MERPTIGQCFDKESGDWDFAYMCDLLNKFIDFQKEEINRLKEEYEQKRKTEHDYLKAANEDLKKEINRLKEEFIPPSDVEILLYSSSNEVYVNDDQRIGFQKGAKWMRKQLSQNKH